MTGLHRRAAVVAAAGLLASGSVAGLAACRDDGGESSVVEGARRPDDQGIATEVERSRVVLDGERRYRVSRELQSFSTYTGEVVPLLAQEGRYVHVGLDGDIVVWIASIAEVFPGEPPVAYYTGQVAEVDDGTVTFVDGTVLRLSEGVAPPAAGDHVTARIDAARHQVVELTVA